MHSIQYEMSHIYEISSSTRYYLARYAKSYPEIGGCKSFNNDEKGSNHKKALTSSRKSFLEVSLLTFLTLN
jgi:hypothetical protein